MFALGNIFDNCVFGATVGIAAAFVVWLAVTAALIRRPRRGAGTFALCVMAVLWTAVFATVLAAALTHFGVFAAEDGGLNIAGLTVPYIGRIAELIDYPVMWAVTAASLAVGIAAFAVAGIRGTARKRELCDGDSMLNTAASAADARLEEASYDTAGQAAQTADQAAQTAGQAAAEETAAVDTVAAYDSAVEASDVETVAADQPDVDTVAAAQTEEPAVADEMREADFTVISVPAGFRLQDEQSAADAGQARSAAGQAVRRGSDNGAKRAAESVLEAREGTALVTRKYVLLNRGNVANMFNEYLNSLSEQDKERLENSLNTIIIK